MKIERKRGCLVRVTPDRTKRQIDSWLPIPLRALLQKAGTSIKPLTVILVTALFDERVAVPDCGHHEPIGIA